ncbi:MAG: InlB B-repeat-containing protein [Lachnospiraceae bacterium]|nr:InlB B-repeat-containing protein [Lachnospiraceae bacterium]
MKKTIVVVLSMLLLLSLLPMTALAEEEPTYPTIAVGDTVRVEPHGTGMEYFLFTPSETGWYAFTSSEEENRAYYGYITVFVDGVYQPAKGWSNYDGDHLRMVYRFSEGMTYRFELECDGMSGAYSMTLSKPKTYTVRFHSGEGKFYDLDTGALTDTSETEIAEGAEIDKFPSIQGLDNGKQFAGWALNSEATIPDIQHWKYLVTADTDLYAVFGKRITVTYDCNGGYANYSGEPSEFFEIPMGAGDWFSSNMAYYPDDAKTFLGWFSAREGGEKYTNDNQMMEDTTVYAHWADKVTVTYDANGGTFPDLDGVSVTTRKCAIGSYVDYYYVEHPEPNMLLIGWYTDPDGGERVTTITEDITVYAHWQKRYLVTCDANGGYFADIPDQPEVVTFALHSEFMSGLEEPVNDDGTLVFDGWYDQKTGGQKYETSDPVPVGKTIYAHWIQGKTIVFDANGGVFNHSGETTLTRGYLPGSYLSEEYNIRRNNMTNADPRKVFLGWASSKTATEPDITFNQQKVDDYSTLYAVWADGIKITEQAGEGYFRGSYDYETGEYEKLKSLEFYVPSGTRVGTLYSYYTGTSGSNGYIKAYTDQPKKGDFDYRSLTANGPVLNYDYVLTEDTELYVIWKDTATITFEAGDGYFTGVASYPPITQKKSEREAGVEQAINYMESFVAKSNDPSKVFMGWSQTGKEEDIITRVTPYEDMTLYAVYKSGKAVTFIPNMNIEFFGMLRGQYFDVGEGYDTVIWPDQTPLASAGLNCVPMENGYYLVGYSTTADGKNLINSSWYPTEKTTLYIIFAEGYNVYIDAYPGNFPSDGSDYLRIGVDKGSAVGTVETPVQPGKIFVGWKEYDTEQMIDPETYIPTRNITLEAVWIDGEEKPKDGWNLIGGVYYYYKDGTVKTGWLESGGKWYYLDPAAGGAMVTGLKKIGSALYFMNELGAMQTGWIDDRGTWFYANSSGAIQTGWVKSGSSWYYMDPTTGAMKTGFVTIGSSTYYMAASGAMQTGWIKDNDIWYFANGSGAVQKGWLKSGSSWYYMDPTTGAMQTGFVTIGNSTYYMAASGAMVTGWFKDNGDWYFANSSGAVQTGWVKSGSTWYYMDPTTGAMKTGFVTIGSSTYYMAASGAMITGWFKDNGNWYFTNGSGAVQKGWTKSGSSWYYMDSETGVMQTGWLNIGTSTYYLEGSGAMVTGWKQIDGTWYYFGSSGAAYKNGVYTIGSTKYAFTESGEWAQYVLNTSTHKFHKPSCSDVEKMNAENIAFSADSRANVVAAGYDPCGHCNP